MKLLYISVHEPLQYDEVSLFLDLGADVDVGTPTGGAPGPNRLRPDVGHPVSWDERTLAGYDVIVVMHDIDALERIHAARRPGQRVIWRTIGQTGPFREEIVRKRCRGVEIVRYSPRERNWPVYAGETAMIRFYKDETEFSGWTGGDGINLLSLAFNRRGLPDHQIVEETLAGLDWALWGSNEGHPRARGLLPAEDLVPMLRRSDLMFATHSLPASYTLNLIEALMTGAPVAALGRRVIERFPHVVEGSPGYPAAMFEVDEILQHGRCGILVDSPNRGRAKIRQLLASRAMAEDLSAAGRARAIELFGKRKVARDWREFLGLPGRQGAD